MKKSDVDYLYEWARTQHFPLRRAPTAVGYSNKDIYFCWLKGHREDHGSIRKSIIDDQRVIDILEDDEILLATISLFESGTELGPHKDPPVYNKSNNSKPKKYRRIQIPLYVPSNECYMIWKGEKVLWEEGVPQVYDVMDHVHAGYNYSNDDLIFLFIDILKKDDNSNLH